MRKATHERTTREASKLKDFIERMEISIKRHLFIAENPIRFLDFLARFTRETYIQEMSEAQAFVTIPSCLQGFAFSRYDAMAGLTPSAE